MTVGRICSRITYLAERGESVQAAARRMQKENVGTLIVVDARSRPVGIVTDRDLALGVVARGLDPRVATVEQVMTPDPSCVPEETAIESAVETMRGLGVRRLPVVDARGSLVGILSVDDVLELVTEELCSLGRLLGLSHSQTWGPAARA